MSFTLPDPVNDNIQCRELLEIERIRNEVLPVDGGVTCALIAALAALDKAISGAAFFEASTFKQCVHAIETGDAALAGMGVSRA